jgi:hypothetical protein
MSDSEKKSVTIRLDEPDLVEWAASQSAAVASIRMAVKICILQYGKDVDLLDAILQAQFGNNGSNTSVRQTSDKSQSALSPNRPITEQIESDNNQNIVVPQAQPNNQSAQPVQPQMNPQMNQQAQPQMQPQYQNQYQNQQMNQNNQAMGQPNQHGISPALSSLL